MIWTNFNRISWQLQYLIRLWYSSGPANLIGFTPDIRLPIDPVQSQTTLDWIYKYLIGLSGKPRALLNSAANFGIFGTSLILRPIIHIFIQKIEPEILKLMISYSCKNIRHFFELLAMSLFFPTYWSKIRIFILNWIFRYLAYSANRDITFFVKAVLLL